MQREEANHACKEKDANARQRIDRYLQYLEQVDLLAEGIRGNQEAAHFPHTRQKLFDAAALYRHLQQGKEIVPPFSPLEVNNTMGDLGISQAYLVMASRLLPHRTVDVLWDRAGARPRGMPASARIETASPSEPYTTQKFTARMLVLWVLMSNDPEEEVPRTNGSLRPC